MACKSLTAHLPPPPPRTSRESLLALRPCVCQKFLGFRLFQKNSKTYKMHTFRRGTTIIPRRNAYLAIELTSEMDSWPNFKLFRPKLSLNRTKNGSNTSGIVPKFETYTKTHGLTWRTSLGKPLSSRESLPARESLLAHLSPLAASLSLSLCLSLQ